MNNRDAIKEGDQLKKGVFLSKISTSFYSKVNYVVNLTSKPETRVFSFQLSRKGRIELHHSGFRKSVGLQDS